MGQRSLYLMPRYDYGCSHGHVQEELHSIHDDPPIVCGVCGRAMTRKVTGGLATLWRGSFSERALSKMPVSEGGLDDW